MDQILNRRQLLIGAAGLAGASLVGKAEALGVGRQSLASLAYWDGERMADPRRIAGERPGIAHVEITLDRVGNVGPLTSVDAIFGSSGGTKGTRSFRAWSVRGNERVRFFMPATEGAIRLELESPSGTQTLRLSHTAGNRLRVGTYALVPGKPDWSKVSLVAEEEGLRLIGLGRTGYLLLHVAQR